VLYCIGGRISSCGIHSGIYLGVYRTAAAAGLHGRAAAEQLANVGVGMRVSFGVIILQRPPTGLTAHNLEIRLGSVLEPSPVQSCPTHLIHRTSFRLQHHLGIHYPRVIIRK
jgi:hypothetical protein